MFKKVKAHVKLGYQNILFALGHFEKALKISVIFLNQIYIYQPSTRLIATTFIFNGDENLSVSSFSRRLNSKIFLETKSDVS